MKYSPLTAGLLLAAALGGCAERTSDPAPLEPGPEEHLTPGPIPVQQDLERGRHERLARRFALALKDDAFRHQVYSAFRASPFREGKVHLQSFLASGTLDWMKRLAEGAGESEPVIQRDLDEAAPIEIYLPVREHRQSWKGDADVLVVTVEKDDDIPVAFDPSGRRLLLDRQQPPKTPVISLVRAETRFDPIPETLNCLFDCSQGAIGSGSTGTSSPGAGLYLTRTRFDGTYEGWPKGEPEFEVHVLGQIGQGDSLTTYSCAGEKAGAPYYFDQNSETWSGSVLLMSQAQIDQYKQNHPNQNLRIFVVEDDDTTCQIKLDDNRLATLLNSLKVTYGNLTGGIDSSKTKPNGTVNRYWGIAKTVFSLFKSVASFFTTQDDPVGNAVADSVPASAWFPSANWLVRGENNQVHGAIRLEVR